MAEEYDWAKVQQEACPQCGFDPRTVLVADLARAIQAEGVAWSEWLTEAAADPDVDLRSRPGSGVWSPLEYASHVRDVYTLFADRIIRMLEEDDAELGWWDHEVAAVEERYNAQEAEEVATALVDNALELARVLTTVPPDGWTRTATRREGETFTVAGLARFALHESSHHRMDARGELRDD
jgi:uncharacterized damage-inducible protein DinB